MILLEKDYAVSATLFRAFCDGYRLKILEYLRSGEKCACDIMEEFSICQSTLSHHMKILSVSGVVTVRKDRRWAYYALSEDVIERAIRILSTYIEQKEVAEIV